MVKRIITIVLILGIILSLNACQSTPEDDIVVQKDQERMIEAANSDNGNSEATTLLEKVDAPETYKNSFTGADGKLIVNVDATVSVPDTDAIPICRVYSSGFSEELADKVYQLLCGGTKMYASSESYTKDAIMEEILAQKQKLASDDLDEESRSNVEDYIKVLEADYQTAPETMGTPITSVTFETKQEYGASYTAFQVRENESGNGGKSFGVRNDTQYKTEEIQTIDGETVAPRSNAHLTYADSDICLQEPYEVREVMGEEKIDEIETTPIEAQAIAQDLLDKIGVDYMEIYSIYLGKKNSKSGNSSKKYGYNVKLRRKVDGICVNSPAYSTYVDDPTYGFEWHYETLNIGISDDGIVSLDWEAPLEVSDVVVADTTLKSFSEIMDVFKSMMCIVNDPPAQNAEEYNSIEFDISNITLSLQRISEQNSVTSGLLIPVWNFYGDEIFTEQDGTSYSRSEMAKAEGVGDEIHYPYLSINAVDGSIIDMSKGY